METTVSEAEMQPWDFNLVVESGAGGGKTTFVQTATEFLEAYGILESSSLIKRSAAELRAGKWDSDDDAKQKATGAFADAREQNGGLLVAEAETLAPSSAISSAANGAGGATSSVTANVLASQTATLGFVALACMEGTAKAVLSAHADLGSRGGPAARGQPKCDHHHPGGVSRGVRQLCREHLRCTNPKPIGCAQ